MTSTPRGGPDWNARYQKLINETPAPDVWRQLTRHYSDFVQKAELYGRTIIEEIPLSDEIRTIKEMKVVGGTAGGKKLLSPIRLR